MAPSIDYITTYNGQATTGLSKTGNQPICIYCYVSDGGGPAADGTTVYWTQWTEDIWLTCPNSTHSPGHGVTATLANTLNGYAPIDPNFNSTLPLKLGGWYVDLVNTPGSAENFPYSSLCTGGVTLSSAIFATPPTVTGIPGDQQILWTWTPGVLLDSTAGLMIHYAIAVSTGTPSSNPTTNPTFSTSFLSTGLTNGTTYNARVQAFFCPGNNGANPLNVSSVRNGSAGGDGVSSIASAVPAISTMAEQWGAIAL